MTRNLLTELVIRLLAIWFFIKFIAALLPTLIYYKDDGKSFLVNLALFIALFGITILFIFFAERISNLTWLNSRTTDDRIDDSVKDNMLVPLISIVGLYFIIDSLAFIIHSLADVFVVLPSLYGKEDSHLYPLSRILYQCLFLIFGIVLFSFPEKLITIRDDLKKTLEKVFKREKVNYKNIEDE
jgi:hypothetical protein